MSAWFAQQLDYIYFLYGLAFALLAVYGALPGRDFPEARRLPWMWIAAFAAIHSAHEWIEMLFLSVDDHAAAPVRLMLLALSFILLLEFGRRSLRLAVLPAGLTAAGLLIPSVLFMLRDQMAESEAALRFFVGMPVAWLGAFALWRAAHSEGERAPAALKTAAGALLVYGAAVSLAPTETGAGPAQLWNAERWLAMTGIPVQIIRTLCAFVLAGAIWRHGFRHAPSFISQAASLSLVRFRTSVLALVVVALLTCLGTEYAGRRASAAARDSMMERVTAIANLLDHAMLSALYESPHDENHPAVRAAEDQLTRARQAFPDVTQIYLYAIYGQTFVFYACSESSIPEIRIRPGTIYEGELFPADYEVFELARPSVIGPFTDSWGQWVSAVVPALYDPEDRSKVRLALGIDIAAKTYVRMLRRWRLAGLITGALVSLLLLDFFSRNHRLGVAALRLAEAERRQRRLSEELDQRVRQRTRELAEANAALQCEMAGHREAEAKYRALTEQVPAITYRVELQPEPRTTYISPQLRQILGYAPEDWVADPDFWKRTLHPDDAARAMEALREADRIGRPMTIDLRMRADNGATRWMRIGANYQFDEQGRPSVVHGVMLDITDQVERDAQLREAGERYRLLFEHSPAGLFHFDRSFRITEVNDRFAALLGRKRDELLGADLGGLITEELSPALKTALAGGESYHEGPHGFIWMRADAWIGVRTAPLFGAERVVIGGIAIVEDLSERRRIEEERMRTQKLESLGLLAGGLAHDFNNILTAVLGNISIARQSAPTGSDLRDALQDAERATLRARDLTHQLLTFAKGGTPIKKLHDVAALVREAASFTVRGSASRCVYEFAPDTWSAELDGGQITQAIQNLIINADQAMPDGGIITLRTSNRVLAKDDVIPLPPGRYVEIKIMDTGVGIPEHLLNRIFDPYFTTKKKGSGLGLTMCFSIIQKHGGHIEVASTEGVGTTFTLLLPAANETAARPATEVHPKDLSGRGRILVMDDERAILTLARRTLEKHGYEALTAENGEEAIRILDAERAAGRAIHLAILDITVPGGMGGRETLRRLRERDLELPALVSSGYAQDEVMAQFKDAGFAGIIPKPYRAEDLLLAVRQALSTPLANPR